MALRRVCVEFCAALEAVGIEPASLVFEKPRRRARLRWSIDDLQCGTVTFVQR